MKRNLERFEAAAKVIETGKMSGAVGTYANIDPFVEQYVCEKLGLTASPISTQTLQRDRHAQYLSVIALVATSIEKFATEIRGLQKSETREVEESSQKVKKVHLQCHINVIQSVLKTWSGYQDLSADI